MAGFSYSTATGAGFGVSGIVSHRSIPINVECVLTSQTNREGTLDCLGKTIGIHLDNIPKYFFGTLVMCGGSWGPMKPMLL